MMRLAAVFALLLITAAHAQVMTCTAAGPSLTFGTVSPYTGFPYSTSGNAALSCSNTGVVTSTAYVCLSVGTGTGGTTATNRTLSSGAATIPIQITGGSSFPAQTGNGTSYPLEGPVGISVPALGTTPGTMPIAVNMPQPGSAPAPSTYTSSFAGADAQIDYTTLALFGSVPASCAALAAGIHSTAQANFSIMATVATGCTVSASSMVFPTSSVLTAIVTATATIAVTCNAPTAVTVALDNGATGTGPTARFMKSGANAITYGIYRDNAGAMPWGNSAGVNTGSIATGTGSLTAFGRIPVQAGPVPGSYSDVVNVIITY